ncbi:MAG: iron uptake porin [Cyanobacteria bacterium J06623_7]
MNNYWSKIILFALGTAIAGTCGNIAQAQTETELLQQIEAYSQEHSQNQIEQVTNVNQLRDVAPTDWSYEAIRSLSDRYGCISGFPNGTYRGNQPITRYEFAAGLNSCFQQIERSVNDKFGQSSNESEQHAVADFAAKIDDLKRQLSE